MRDEELVKPIRITPYCEGRIAARKVERELVEQVVRSPEQIMPDADDPARQIYQSRFVDGQGRPKLLRVVLEEMVNEIIAVTVYPTSQIERYWKTEP